MLFAGYANAACEILKPGVALIALDDDKAQMIDTKVLSEEQVAEQILADDESEIILLPTPTVAKNVDAEKPPGTWLDEQKLTLETFKEIVATDVENVWVVAYIDPRCKDCLVLSLEWEKLAQVEEREKRKIKLGYVDISVEENWKIVQDHTKGKKMTHTPAVTLYGENKESPFWYQKEKEPSAKGVHSWYTSYADHHGYGWWDPDNYSGSGIPQ